MNLHGTLIGNKKRFCVNVNKKPINNGGAESGELDDGDDSGQGEKWKESRQSFE